MEPQIRYATSADGTSIATATLGAGPPLVLLPMGPLASIESLFALPGMRRQLERLAERHTFVTYDHRGTGFSDREVADVSLEATVGDLQAVVESLGEAAVCVLAQFQASPSAIVFAATCPARVRRLVLWSPIAKGRDVRPGDRYRIIAPLVDVDWELYCQMFALLGFGWTDAGKMFGSIGARSEDPDTLKRRWQAFRAYDATASLADVRCPTLVVVPEGRDTVVPMAVARRIAATIPGARLRTGAESSGGLFTDHPAADGDVILEFLAEDDAMAPTATASGTAIILFADIVDSTALTERLGDAAFRERARALDGLLRTIIVESGGTPIDGKLLGDGVLATFPAASQGIAAALAFAGAAEAAQLQLHLGLHAGDVIREENNVYGGAVNIASRISALSAPGEVLVSRTVADLARTSAGVAFDDRGEHALKGVGEPVRVYAVRREDGA